MKCTKCKFTMQKAGKNHVTLKGRFQKYKCIKCGKISIGEVLEKFE